jgi:hypothetical protein
MSNETGGSHCSLCDNVAVIHRENAAQRERISELEAADTAKFLEILKLRSDCDEHCQDWTRAQLSLNHAKTQLATVTQERDNWYGHHANEYERAEALQVRVQELEQECEQDHCDILVCTGCGRTSKHGWIGIVYESTPNSAEEYDTKCPECGSMSLDEDARSVVNELDVCKAQIATAEARVRELEGALQSIANNTCCDRCQEAALVARAALHTPEEQL